MPQETALRQFMRAAKLSPTVLAEKLAALDPPFIAAAGHIRNVRDGYRRSGIDLAKAIERAVGSVAPGITAAAILLWEPEPASTPTADPTAA